MLDDLPISWSIDSHLLVSCYSKVVKTPRIVSKPDLLTSKRVYLHVESKRKAMGRKWLKLAPFCCAYQRTTRTTFEYLELFSFTYYILQWEMETHCLNCCESSVYLFRTPPRRGFRNVDNLRKFSWQPSRSRKKSLLLVVIITCLCLFVLEKESIVISSHVRSWMGNIILAKMPISAQFACATIFFV